MARHGGLSQIRPRVESRRAAPRADRTATPLRSLPRCWRLWTDVQRTHGPQLHRAHIVIYERILSGLGDDQIEDDALSRRDGVGRHAGQSVLGIAIWIDGGEHRPNHVKGTREAWPRV